MKEQEEKKKEDRKVVAFLATHPQNHNGFPTRRKKTQRASGPPHFYKKDLRKFLKNRFICGNCHHHWSHGFN